MINLNRHMLMIEDDSLLVLAKAGSFGMLIGVGGGIGAAYGAVIGGWSGAAIGFGIGVNIGGSIGIVRARLRRGVKPPSNLDGAKVLEYAVVDARLRLAICQETDAGPEAFLFRCDNEWDVICVIGAYCSVESAKEAAHDMGYEGTLSKWVKMRDAAATCAKS